MKRTRVPGLATTAAGVLLVLVSLLADVIGIGAFPASIGWKQFLGAAVGLVVTVIGVYMLLAARPPA